MNIEGRKIAARDNFLDKVTYVPAHVNGNAGHKDCEQGVISQTWWQILVELQPLGVIKG